MLVAAVAVAVAIGFLAYRLTMSVKSVKARRAGKAEPAEAFSLKGHQAFVGTSAALTLLLMIFVVVAVASR